VVALGCNGWQLTQQLPQPSHYWEPRVEPILNRHPGIWPEPCVCVCGMTTFRNTKASCLFASWAHLYFICHERHVDAWAWRSCIGGFRASNMFVRSEILHVGEGKSKEKKCTHNMSSKAGMPHPCPCIPAYLVYTDIDPWDYIPVQNPQASGYS